MDFNRMEPDEAFPSDDPKRLTIKTKSGWTLTRDFQTFAEADEALHRVLVDPCDLRLPSGLQAGEFVAIYLQTEIITNIETADCGIEA